MAAVERATAVFAAARVDPGAADHARRAVEAARRTDNLALHGRTLELLGRLDPSSGGLAEAAEAYRRKGDESALGRLG